jgi:hypothetical protein
MVEHTPGPWVVNGKHPARQNCAESVIEQDFGSAPIAKVFEIYGNQMRGNAYLIAAAPELLRVVIAFVEACDKAGITDLNIEYLADARAAIAKATGVPPCL